MTSLLIPYQIADIRTIVLSLEEQEMGVRTKYLEPRSGSPEPSMIVYRYGQYYGHITPIHGTSFVSNYTDAEKHPGIIYGKKLIKFLFSSGKFRKQFTTKYIEFSKVFKCN